MIFIDNRVISSEVALCVEWKLWLDFTEVVKRSDFNLFLIKRWVNVCILHIENTLIVIYFCLFWIEKSRLNYMQHEKNVYRKTF